MERTKVMSITAAISRAPRAIIAIAFVLMLAAPAFAQSTAAPARKPTKAEVDLARQIILLKGAASVFEALVPGVIEQNKNTLLVQNPMLQKDLNDVAAQLRTEMAPRTSEVITQVATFYAASFTEQELKDLYAFYNSPLGKKANTQEPRAIEQGVSYAQEWAFKLSDEVLTRLRAELKKKGHDL
jgi:uncharacterized protein